jgi:outer membrane lipoprotein SlyB
MKKGLISIVCLIVLSISAIPVGAQTRSRRYDTRRYEQRYDTGRYNGRYNRDWDESVWDRHRDKITTAAGAGGGALLGAIIGGKKGAIIGAIAGGGGAAIYTYGIRDKDNDRYRYRNRRY